MSQPFSLSTATSLTSTGTSAIVVDAASESLPNAADASPKNGRAFSRTFTLQFPRKKKVPETAMIPKLKVKKKVLSEIFLSVNSVDLIVLRHRSALLYLQRAFRSHVDPPSKSSSSSRQEFSPSDSTTTPMLSDHPRIPSKSSSFPDDQLSDHPSESSSSAFSATSASDFNHRALLSAVEQLHPALDELRAWRQAWQPVIDRVQAQQRDSDLVLRDILSELRRLQSSRATQDLRLHALFSQTVAWQQQIVTEYRQNLDRL